MRSQPRLPVLGALLLPAVRAVALHRLPPVRPPAAARVRAPPAAVPRLQGPHLDAPWRFATSCEVRKQRRGCLLRQLLLAGAELRDLAGAEPEQVARLAAELEAVEAGMRALRRGAAADLDPETRRVLSGLGYGGGDDR